MSPEEIAWIAGIIDSEGTVYQVKKRSGAPGSPVLGIYNVNKQFLEKVSSTIGASDAYVFSYIGNGIKRRPIHEVRLQRRRTLLPLFEQVLPWLIVKREKVEQALKWYREHEPYQKTIRTGRTS